MSELWGVVAAAASSALGGTSIAATRYLVGHLDPLAIGSFRFGIGCLLLAPVALLGDRRWPKSGKPNEHCDALRDESQTRLDDSISINQVELPA